MSCSPVRTLCVAQRALLRFVLLLSLLSLLPALPLLAAPPAAPSNLTVGFSAPTTASLRWTDNSTNDNSFTIERKVDGQPDTAFVSVGSADSTDIGGTGGTLSFSDPGLAFDTVYDYRVKALAADGTASDYSNIAVGTTAPVPPINLSVSAVANSDSQLSLTWTDNAQHTYTFHVWRKAPGETDFTQHATYGGPYGGGAVGKGNSFTWTDTNLIANTTYSYYVTAYNSAGDSGPSNSVTGTTNLAQSVPSAPGLSASAGSTGSDGTADPRTTTTYSVTDQSNNATSLTVQRRNADDTASVFVTLPGYPKSVTPGAGNSFRGYDTGLAVDTAYAYQAFATNSRGNSPVVTATTYTVPITPINLTVAPVANSDSQLSLTWTDNAQHTYTFHVWRKAPGETDFTQHATYGGPYGGGAVGKGNSFTWKDTNLIANTTYSYYVTAYNGAGDSGPSNSVTGTTNLAQSVPSAPGLSASAGSRGSDGTADPHTTVSYSTYDSSTNATSLTVQRKNADDASSVFVTLPGYPKSVTAGAGNSFGGYDTGLAVDTGYTYQAFATNSRGNSSVAAATTYTVPVAPINLSVSAVANSDSQLSLTWTDNAQHTYTFHVWRKAPGETDFTQHATYGGPYGGGAVGKGNSFTWTDTNLIANTTYSYYVTAYNSAGDSGPSNSVTGTTNLAQSVPSAPGLSASAGSRGSDGTADPHTTVSYSTYDSSTNATSLTVQRKNADDASSVFVTLPGYPKSVTAGAGNSFGGYDTGLAVDTGYTYQAFATNSRGNSSVAAATTYTVPVAPITVQATALSDTRIRLTFVDNAQHTYTFHIWRKGPGETDFTQHATYGGPYGGGAVGKGTLFTYTDTGLTANSTYAYYVTAYNSAGDSGPSDTATATTFPSNPPGAPTGLQAAGASATQVNLNWLDNSTDEYGFVVEREAESETAFTALSGANAGDPTVGPQAGTGRVYYSDKTASADTAYTYRVKAVNPAGDSAYSNTATAATAPAAPTGLSGVAVNGTSVTLTWTDHAKHEDGFFIYRKGPGDSSPQKISTTASASGTGSTVTYSDTTVTANARYVYSVTAYNGAGESAASNTATVLTNVNPAPTITSLDPPSLVAGSDPTLFVNGTNFIQNVTTATIGGESTGIAGFAATRLQLRVPDDIITVPGTYTVALSNGGAAATATLTITVLAPNPKPVISSLDASSLLVNSDPTLFVNGTGFLNPGTTATIHGEATSIAGFAATRLQLRVPDDVISTVGTYTLKLTNPPAPYGGGGGGSTTATLTILARDPAAPAPTITSLNPSSVQKGSGGVLLTVNGTGYSRTTTLTFGGQTLTVQGFSTTQLLVSVPSNLLQSGGPVTVTVTNPPTNGGGGGAASATFNVLDPALQYQLQLSVGDQVSWVGNTSLFTVVVKNIGTSPQILTSASVTGISGWASLQSALPTDPLLPGDAIYLTFQLAVPTNASGGAPGSPVTHTPTLIIGAQGSYSQSFGLAVFREPITQVEVTVLNDATGSPISGALVALDNSDALYVTDSSGTVTLDAVQGSANVFAYASGYLPGQASLSIGNGAATPVTLRLTAGQALQVKSVEVNPISPAQAARDGVNLADPQNYNIYDFTINFGVVSYRIPDVVIPKLPKPGTTQTGTVKPGPNICNLNPKSIPAGPNGNVVETITITGTGFVSGCKVQYNGADQVVGTDGQFKNIVTTFHSSTEVLATIPYNDVYTHPGDYGLSVRNPDGSVSNVAKFLITDPNNQPHLSLPTAFTAHVVDDGSGSVQLLVEVPITNTGSGAAYNVILDHAPHGLSPAILYQIGSGFDIRQSFTTTPVNSTFTLKPGETKTAHLVFPYDAAAHNAGLTLVTACDYLPGGAVANDVPITVETPPFSTAQTGDEPSDENSCADDNTGGNVVINYKIVYPTSDPTQRIETYVVVPGDIRILKQFWEATVLIRNNSALLIKNLVATLSVPNGLALPDLHGAPQPNVKNLGDLPARSNAQALYVVRGDRAGTYTLTGSANGTLQLGGGNVPLVSTLTSAPFQVIEPKLNVSFHLPSKVKAGVEFSLKITIENQSIIDLNGVSIELKANKLIHCHLAPSQSTSRYIGKILTGDSATVTFHLVPDVSGRVQDISSYVSATPAIAPNIAVQAVTLNAVNDMATTLAGAAVSIPVLANDAGSGALTILSTTSAAHGRVRTNGATVTYTPSAGYVGTDGFSYTVQDEAGHTATALVSLTVIAPSASITSLSPDSAAAGSSSFTLTINGTGFVAASQASWNGQARATTYVSPTKLTLRVSKSDLSSAGTVPVTVTNPGISGFASQIFTVTNPVPTLGTLRPAATTANAAFPLTLVGTGFVTTTTVTLTGGGHTVTLSPSTMTATHLTVTVPASAIVAVGAYLVTVTNPTPGGGSSGAKTLTVGLPILGLTGLTFGRDGSGNITATLTVTNSSAITVAGAALTSATLVTSGAPVKLSGLALLLPGLAGPNSTGTTTVTFPGTAALAGSAVRGISATGSYNGGVFSGSRRGIL